MGKIVKKLIFVCSNYNINIKEFYKNLDDELDLVNCLQAFEFRHKEHIKGRLVDSFIMALPKSIYDDSKLIAFLRKFITDDNRCFETIIKHGFISGSLYKTLPSRYIINNFMINQVDINKKLINSDYLLSEKYISDVNRDQAHFFIEVYFIGGTIEEGFIIIPYDR